MELETAWNGAVDDECHDLIDLSLRHRRIHVEPSPSRRAKIRTVSEVVLAALRREGPCQLRDLCRVTDLDRPSLRATLFCLRERGLVTASGAKRKYVYRLAEE